MNWNIIQKEVKENLFAMKGVVWLFVVTLLFSGMTYSFITVKELSLLAQTEVIVTMGKLILGVALLISIILASVSFSNEREQSTLESLMLTPVSGLELAQGKLMGTLLMWLLIFVSAVPYILTLSYGTSLGFTTVLLILILGTIVIVTFANLSISLSVLMGSSKNAMITSIIIFLITAIPGFLSTTMKKVGFGLILERLSPLSNAINLLKEIIINRQDLLSLTKYISPLLIYAVLSYFVLIFAIKRFNFEGGE